MTVKYCWIAVMSSRVLRCTPRRIWFSVNSTNLSTFRGRPVVLNLWATECGGCKAEFVRSHGLPYTIFMDDGSVEKDYRVTAMPSTFVIDKRGRVAATYVGVVDSTDLLEKVLAVVAERE